MDFAIIQTYGKQYTVAEGDVIKLSVRMEENSKTMNFDEVLLVHKDGKTVVGKPFISNASVAGEVVDQGRDRKIIIFKYKPKKRYRVTTRHPHHFSPLNISKNKP